MQKAKKFSFFVIHKHIVKHVITLCIPKLLKTKFSLFSFTVYKNEWKEHKFRWQKNQKSEFYKNKKVTNIDDVDVNKILVSKKELYGTKNSFKYFIAYNDNDVIRPLCVRLPQMTGYAKKFHENATMSFRANNKQLLKNYNKIWEAVEKLLKIELVVENRATQDTFQSLKVNCFCHFHIPFFYIFET